MNRVAPPRAVYSACSAPVALAAAAAVVLSLGGCGLPVGPAPEPEAAEDSAGLLFGDGGIPLENLFGGAPSPREGGAIGVNAFLWRASLDTVSFLPLLSADPFGGVIITDWYAPPEAGGRERLKLSVFILDRRLRADGIKVSVFRQERDGDGWRDVAVGPSSATEVEDTILTRAREMWLDTEPEN